MSNLIRPKVFVSYSWTNPEYEERVNEFVDRLRSVGIDTIYDKYDLEPGASTHAFMEKSVVDPSVTKVLILCDKKYVEKGNKDVMFNYQVAKVTETLDSDEEKEIPEDLYVIGIRPEFIKLSDDGKVSGEIYNALPSGMETIVKIRVSEFLLTSVIFGGVDYKVGSKCKLDFFGKEILLFDRKSGKLLSQGGLEEVN